MKQSFDSPAKLGQLVYQSLRELADIRRRIMVRSGPVAPGRIFISYRIGGRKLLIPPDGSLSA